MILSLCDNWEFAATEANAIADDAMLAKADLDWLAAQVPGTVAQSYTASGKHNLLSQRYDDYDYWYRCQFSVAADCKAGALVFNGLATLADVWLNGKKILSSDNMFLRHKVDVANVLVEKNSLLICFRSISLTLKQKRPRPRWKTRLIANQQLRWIRTTLLGRIPGWAAAPAAVGPWKEIILLTPDEISSDDISLTASIRDKAGIVDISINVNAEAYKEKNYIFSIGDTETVLKNTPSESGAVLTGQLAIEDVNLWWPHTHGEPYLYYPVLKIEGDGEAREITLNPIGFKQIELESPAGDFTVKVNNKKIFCRGACWTINDIESLVGSTESLQHTLTLMRDAGANMIRIGGTMIYEQEAFYKLCDELGIMVWQDFMFANMDYPIDNDVFQQSVISEITQTVKRLGKHVCISMYCGNSEIEQQAAMLGIDREKWRSALFENIIPDLCRLYHKDIPYIPSSPSEGTLPFHVNRGVAHYYGVGAYLRPISEVRKHDVKFTSECLGFANVPVTRTRNQVLDGDLPVTHDPRWKARTPRDSGTGWDFEDVRDHYLKLLYSVDPVALRSFNSQRYMELSEITTGEVMRQVFAEWRSAYSNCNGGLIWFLKDFWPGAGWGIIDSTNTPKACYYFLKRIWQPVTVCMSNESINGIAIHIVNDSRNITSGILELTLIQDDRIVIAKVCREITIQPEAIQTYQSDELLAAFYDVSYSYRFGPSRHNIVAVRLVDADGKLLSDDYHFPLSVEPKVDSNINMTVTAEKTDINTYTLELISDTFLYGVCIDVPGYLPEMNFFYLMPEERMRINIISSGQQYGSLKGYVSALNLTEAKKITVIANQ